MQYYHVEAGMQESRKHVLMEPKQRSSRQDKATDCGGRLLSEPLPSYTEEMKSAMRTCRQSEDAWTLKETASRMMLHKHL